MKVLIQRELNVSDFFLSFLKFSKFDEKNKRELEGTLLAAKQTIEKQAHEFQKAAERLEAKCIEDVAEEREREAHLGAAGRVIGRVPGGQTVAVQPLPADRQGGTGLAGDGGIDREQHLDRRRRLSGTAVFERLTRTVAGHLDREIGRNRRAPR